MEKLMGSEGETRNEKEREASRKLKMKRRMESEKVKLDLKEIMGCENGELEMKQ